MKKANDPHLVRVVLRDWSKVRKTNTHIVAEKAERKETKNGKS